MNLSYLEISGRQSGKTGRLINMVEEKCNETYGSAEKIFIVTPNSVISNNIRERINPVFERANKIKFLYSLEDLRSENVNHIFFDEFDHIEFPKMFGFLYECPTNYNGYFFTTPRSLRNNENSNDDILLELIRRATRRNIPIIRERNIEVSFRYRMEQNPRDIFRTEYLGEWLENQEGQRESDSIERIRRTNSVETIDIETPIGAALTMREFLGDVFALPTYSLVGNENITLNTQPQNVLFGSGENLEDLISRKVEEKLREMQKKVELDKPIEIGKMGRIIDI